MVTNLIYYLYGIKVNVIREHNGKYIFSINNNLYIFKEIFDENKVYKNISYIDTNLYHEIIRDVKNRVVSSYNNHLYVLMAVKIGVNRNIIIDDLMQNRILYYINLNSFKWIELWKNKIDQVEHIIRSNEYKFSFSNLSIINYYLELSEIALCFLLNYIESNQRISMSLCHERIRNNYSLYDLYDSTDLIIDNYTRDIGEYIKCDIISGYFDSKRYVFIKYINYVDKVLLFSRILFPSYFYDIFDDYVLNDKSFESFDNNFLFINEYSKCIKELFDFM